MRVKRLVVGLLCALLLICVLPISSAKASEADNTAILQVSAQEKTTAQLPQDKMLAMPVPLGRDSGSYESMAALGMFRTRKAAGQYGSAGVYPEGAGTYTHQFNHDTQVQTVIAIPQVGYTFQCWLEDYLDSNGDPALRFYSASNVISFQTPTSLSLIAVFRKGGQYFLFYPADGECVTSTVDDEKLTYAPGDTVTIRASAKSGFRVAGIQMATYPNDRFWEFDGDSDLEYTTISGDDPTVATFTMPKGDVTININYYTDQYHDLTVETNITGGTIRILKDGQAVTSARYLAGEKVKLLITPNENWYLGTIFGVSSDFSFNDYSFTMCDADMYISAEFRQRKVVSISCSVTPGKIGEFATIARGEKDGRYMFYAAALKTNYEFDGWYEIVNGQEVLYSDDPVIWITPERDMSLVAHFVELYYCYVYNKDSHGTLHVLPDKQWFRPGTTITLSGVPDDEYVLDCFAKGEIVGTTASLERFDGNSFEMPEYNVAVAAFFVRAYSVSATANISEGGTAEGSGAYKSGTEAVLVATPAEGYYFENWTENGTVCGTSETLKVRIYSDRQFVANFKRIQYTVQASANPNAGGTVSGAGTYDYGKSVTLKATAATGYEFVSWTENGNIVSTSATYSFTPSSNRTLVANFAIKLYDVGILANIMTAGTVSGAGTYEHGATVSLTASPEDGYRFLYWSENGAQVSTSATYTFTAVASHMFVANFEVIPTYNIEASASDENGGSVTGGGEYREGTEVTLVATVADGYVFGGWLVEGSCVCSNPTYKFNATEDVDIMALFTPIPVYTVTAVASDPNGGLVTGGGDYRDGTEITLSVTVADGYVFGGWSVDGSVVSDGSTYTFTVSKDIEVVAVVTAIPVYSITIEPNYEFGGMLDGAGEYREGTEVTLTVDVADGYVFQYWSKNGEIVCNTTTYKFIATESCEINAIFAMIPVYTITASVNDVNGGSVTGGGEYREGTNVTLTATPIGDYVFVGWYVDGAKVCNDPTYSFTASEDIEVIANFSAIPVYSIEANANIANAGTVTGAGDYLENAQVTLTAAARGGYTFINWTENGSVVSTNATISFKATEDRDLIAIFEQDLKITKNPTDVTVTEGKTAKFTVTPNINNIYIAYQWQTKAPNSTVWRDSNSTNATNATLTLTAKMAHNGYQFRCIVTDVDNGTTVTTDPVTLTVTAAPVAPVITTQPKDMTVLVGKTAKFTVAATGTGTLKYQWQTKAPNSTSWKNSTSTAAKKATFSITVQLAHNGYQFRCIITDDTGLSTTSDAATVTVEEPGPSITKQPVDATVEAGKTAKFTVAANGSGTLTYQWQTKAPNSTNWKNSTSTAAKKATFSLTVKMAHNGYQFRCIITDGNGKTVTSAAATVTVEEPGPSITTQPSDANVSIGTVAKFTVAATGTGTLTYQWQTKAPGAEWKNSSSVTSTKTTFTITAKEALNGYQFRCVVTDGNGKTAISNEVTITVALTTVGPKITTQPKSTSVTAGTAAKFKVVATGEGTLTYQWQILAPNATTWKNSTSTSATKATFSITTKAAHNGYKVRCIVTDANGQATSSVATLTVE